MSTGPANGPARPAPIRAEPGHGRGFAPGSLLLVALTFSSLVGCLSPSPAGTPTAQPTPIAEVSTIATPPPVAEATPIVAVAEPDSAPATEPTPAPAAIVVSEPQPPSDAATPSPARAGFAVLLLGYGGGGHDGAYLTDAMMVVIADPDRKAVTLLSLPRDIWAPATFDGREYVYGKLNTVYAYARDPELYPGRLDRYQGVHGPGALARDTISRLLGIPIDSYLALDFAGFRQLVDVFGGVDVDVPTAFAAQYPRNDNPRVDPGWMIVRFAPGFEHMDGERALEYTRARLTINSPTEGNDFARLNRQRIVLDALRSKVLTPAGFAHLPDVLLLARRYSDTDYPLPATTDLVRLAAAWGDVHIYQSTLSLSNYLAEATGPDDAYIVVPRTAGASWSQARAFVRRLRADPALGQAMGETSIVVVNRTGQAGVADRITSRLASLGYVIGKADTGPVRQRTVLRDQAGASVNVLLDALSRDLGLGDPDVAVEPEGAAKQVIVELGQDALRGLNADPPAPDREAPSSAFGVSVFGQWLPSAPAVAQAVPARASAGGSTPGPAGAAPLASRAAGTSGTVTPTGATSPPRPGQAPAAATPTPKRTLPGAPRPAPVPKGTPEASAR